MQIVRNAVRENRLSDPSLVKDSDYAELMNNGKGWVCESDNRITGFAFADLRNENIWALFVLPEAEGNGVGKTLHDLMMDWYFNSGKNYVWLSTAPGTRAESFYRKAGWMQNGYYGKGELKFEMTLEDWNKARDESNL